MVHIFEFECCDEMEIHLDDYYGNGNDDDGFQKDLDLYRSYYRCCCDLDCPHFLLVQFDIIILNLSWEKTNRQQHAFFLYNNNGDDDLYSIFRTQ